MVNNMNFNIEYKVKDAKNWDNDITLYVSVITDSDKFTMDMLQGSANLIKLYDNNRNWFIPRDSIELIHSSTDERINLGKFIRYNDREGNIAATVVFSKHINHNDMDLIIHKLSFKNSLRWSLHSAGFVNAKYFYGESETLKINAEGNKI